MRILRGFKVCFFLEKFFFVVFRVRIEDYLIFRGLGLELGFKCGFFVIISLKWGGYYRVDVFRFGYWIFFGFY